MAAETPRLHDVENVPAFCARVLAAELKSNGGYMRPEMREEALQFLIELTYQLALRFELRTLTFAEYAGRILSLRMADFYRGQLGDKRSKRHVQTLWLDGLDLDENVPARLRSESHEDDTLTRVACA